MIHGRNLIVALDGVAVAGAKSCSLQLSQNFIETCSPDSGRVHEKKPTTYDWSVSVDCLVPNSGMTSNLKNTLIAGTKCLITFTDSSNDSRAGFAYIKSCDEAGSVGSLATFKVSFESTGALYRCGIYKIENFTEGYSKQLYVNDGVISYAFSGGAGIKGVAITISGTAQNKLYLMLSGDWAVYNTNFANIKTMLDNHDSAGLNSYAIACGKDRGDDINLGNGQYTVLGFNYSSPTTIIRMYE